MLNRFIGSVDYGDEPDFDMPGVDPVAGEDLETHFTSRGGRQRQVDRRVGQISPRRFPGRTDE